MNNIDIIKELELSKEQAASNDEIFDAVYELCKTMTEDSELDWDMSFIGGLADQAASVLTEHGFKVRFPAVVTNFDCSQYIEDFYEV